MRIEKISLIPANKLFGFLFLALLLLHIVAPISLFFPVKKKFLKYASQVLQRSKKSLIYLDLTIEKFASYKIKGQNELIIKGEYYDFKDLRIEAGMVRVFVYHDKMESEFQKNIASLFSQKSSDGKPKLSLISKIFDLFFSHNQNKEEQQWCELMHQYFCKNSQYSFIKINQFFEPPELYLLS
jgi:hypothetical protein